MRLPLLASFALVACSSVPPAAGPTAPEFAWTELGAGGATLVRAVANGPCPLLTSGGFSIPMHERAPPSPDFPHAVCEATAPSGLHSFRVAGTAVPDGDTPARRILFLGDTGCRIKADPKSGKVAFQKCNDPAAWPFARLAAAAAAWKPDLVVHVGDYHYREADCPANEPACAGSETGDRWPSWRQDFFVPAAPLLAAAPWIFVRGNHESCARAGGGWFRLLDAGDVPARCSDSVAPFEVPVPGHRLYVLDSAKEDNLEPSLAAVKASERGALTWLLLHRPFLTPGGDDEALTRTKLPRRLAGPGAVSAVFTGHRHFLSLHGFEDSRPPEMITGNGGDTLDPLPGGHSDRATDLTFHDFGFLTLERTASGGPWIVQEHDRTGAVIGTCSLTELAGQKTELRCR